MEIPAKDNKDLHRRERRRYPRVKDNFQFDILHKGLLIPAQIRDISCCGLYCQIEKPLIPMSRVSLIMNLPIISADTTLFEQVDIEGVIVRQALAEAGNAKAYNIAIFFDHVSNANKHKIATYVNNRLTASETPTTTKW